MSKTAGIVVSLTISLLTSVAVLADDVSPAPAPAAQAPSIANAATPAPPTPPVPVAPGATSQPVTLNISASSVPLTTELNVLSKESNTPIVYDNTVKSSIGESHIKLPTLDAMLNFLKVKYAGLMVQRVYLPADKPIPSGADLYAQVQALKLIQSSGIVLVGADPGSTISFTRGNAPDTAPDGMKSVYLVTDETARAQMMASAVQPTAQQPAQGGAPPAGSAGTAAGINPATLLSPAAARQAWIQQRAAARAARQQQLLQQQQQQQQVQPQATPSTAPPAPNL